MKKKLSLLMVFVFAMFSSTVYAEGVALTDDQMDEIAAGEWVVVKDGEEVEDVHFNANDIYLTDGSQQEITGVSNANIVDSAVAIQYNIASVEGTPSENVGINGLNEATIANYNPYDEYATSESTSKVSTLFAHDVLLATEHKEAHAALAASAAYSKVETLDITEDFDLAFALAAASEGRDKGERSESAIATALVITNDYVLDYDLVESASAAASASASEIWDASLFAEATFTADCAESTSSSSYSRSDKSENNHIELDDEAQKNLQVVSNMNVVGSGAAVQQNIASNVGVTGTITHANIANVSNGGSNL